MNWKQAMRAMIEGQKVRFIEWHPDIWADTIIETPEDKGVFTSLLNAGLARHTGKGRDAGVCLTEDGFTAYQVLQEG